MTIEEVYEKYEHMDKILSDNRWLSETFEGQMLNDLWQTVKEEHERTGKEHER